MHPSREWAADVDRRLAQDRSDIDSLYEISERIEGKIDRLSDRVETRFEQMDTRFDGVDTRFDTLSDEMAGQRVLLEQILERLDRD